jgi:hypothetical protein
VEVVGECEPGAPVFDCEVKLELRHESATAAGVFFAACQKLGVEVK